MSSSQLFTKENIPYKKVTVNPEKIVKIRKMAIERPEKGLP